VLKDIVEARALDGYRLYLGFEDGTAGEIDVSAMVKFEGVFAPLRNPARFAEVRVNSDHGAVYWPGGGDLDPDVLYAKVAGLPPPDAA
jgi:hypothetical protein